ncbi:unnamed protein product, partial [Laminaria digitata]
QVWVSPASPVFHADRQAVSPSAHSLPAPRGSLVRRQYTQPPHRRQGGGSSREAGRKAKEGATVGANTSDERKICRAVANTSIDNDNNGSGCSSGNRPRSRERTSREGEGRIDKAQGNRCGDSESGGGGGGTRGPALALGLGGCDEAWGAAAVAVARNSERLLSGAGSCQGSKSSTGSELWAWAGVGGGAARGKAMLSAYGLQADRHNPTCPRGNPGDGTRRHVRWQRDHGGGTGRAEAGGGDGSDIGLQKSGGLEGDGAAQCRGGGRGGRGSGRGGSKPSNRVSAGHAHNFFGGGGRKQRSVAARSKPSGPARRSRDHSSSAGRDQGVGEGEGGSSDRARQTPGAAPGVWEEDGSGAMSTAAASPRIVDSPAARERAVQEGGRPADQIQRALEGLLVPDQGPAPSRSRLAQGSHQGANTVATAAGVSATIPAAVSGHMSVLTMDGRGGSAAPPYRPQQLSLRAPTTASCAPVLPGLAGPGGSGMAMIAAFEAAESTSVDGGSGGDDHSTPPVSRQRAHSHHSPWQARKHPRGVFGGRGGGGFGRCHHGRQEHPLVGEKIKSGSGGRPGGCYSSESASNRSAFVTPSADSAARAEAGAGSTDRSSTVVVGASTATSDAAADGAPRGGLDPFDRLLHGAAAELPQSELIDHYKLAPRPTSRRGIRSQGVEGQSAQPEPAFSLFSRQRDGVACGSGRAVEDKAQQGEEEERKQRG